MFIIVFFPKLNVVLCIMSMWEGCNLVYLRQGRQCVTWCSSDEVGDHSSPHSENPGHAPVTQNVFMESSKTLQPLLRSIKYFMPPLFQLPQL